MASLRLGLWLGVALLSACASANTPGLAAADARPACEVGPKRVASVPGISSNQGQLHTWTAALDAGEGDRVLLASDEIAALNARNRGDAWGFQDVLSDAIASPTHTQRELEERVVWLQERLTSHKLVEGEVGMFSTARERIDKASSVVESRLVAVETDLRCIPSTKGLFTQPVDRDFDRNQCSRLHLGELVRVLRISEDGQWRYVHAGHSVGWVQGKVLTPPLLLEDAQAFRAPHKSLVVTADGGALPDGRALRMGTRLPLTAGTDGDLEVVVPTTTGLVSTTLPPSDRHHVGSLPFTRANVWRLALATFGDPYGWGGRGGARDCSRLVLDVFAVFGLELGRHSLAQARAGARTVELTGLDEDAKRAAIREAAHDNVVLLYMSGHIMLYLGEQAGRVYAVSPISEFLVPCAGQGDQVTRIDQTVVTDLEVGRDTERRAFIERMKRLAVFGK